MKTIRLISSTIAAFGTAVGVLIALINWAKLQDISWMTFAAVLFVTLISFLLLYFISIEPIRKNNKCIGDKLDSHFDILKKNTQEIIFAVSELQLKSGSACLHPLSPKSAGDWAIPGSPLHLSNSGKNLLEKSGMDKIVNENIEELILKMEELKLNTAYDVQEKSFIILGKLIFERPEFEKDVKDFVFNNPVLDNIGVGFRDVIFVGSLLLRDKYLEKYPELKKKD